MGRNGMQKSVDRLMTKAVLYLPVILYKFRKNQTRLIVGTFAIVTSVATIKIALRLYWSHVWMVKRRKWQEKQRAIKQAMLNVLSQKVSEDAMSQIESLDIITLQKQLQSGQLNPSTVLYCFQKKALEQDRKFNFIAEIIEEAEEQSNHLVATSSEEKGMLYGLPISVKECIAIKGYDTHYGKTANLGKPAQDDSVIVKVLRLQGAIPFIRTNLPQLSHSYQCSNPIVGLTVNPLDPSRGPGGSSGGEGAAGACGASKLGIGSDLGGSIRVPAHYCGLCGLKPTCGRISVARSPLRVSSMDIVTAIHGPLSTDMAGLTLLSRALMSEHMYTLDRSMVPVPFREEMYSGQKKLRIGFYVDNNIFTPVPPVKRAVEEAVQILRDDGHEIVEIHMDGGATEDAIAEIYCPSRSVHRLQEHWKVMKYDEIDPGIEDIYDKSTYPIWLTNLKSFYLKHKKSAEPYSAKLWKGWQGTKLAADWLALRGKYNKFREHHLRQWRSLNIDVVICPVTGLVTPPLGVAEQLDHSAYVYARLYNLIDFPAGAVPVTKVQERDIQLMASYPTQGEYEDGHKVMEGAVGLPVGVQVVSLPFQEEMCLRVMTLLEEKAGYLQK